MSGHRFRSDNLRAAPRWITPEIVGRILALAMPGEVPVPIVQVPTRGVKPRLEIVAAETGADSQTERKCSNPPLASTHSRRTEESEAASNGPTHAASPRRGQPLPITKPQTAACPLDYNQVRAAETAAQIDAEKPLFRIAFDRGISIVDLAHALGQKEATVSLHTRIAGFRFGRRQPLADRLTIEQLEALADPSVPLPELRCDRLKRERLAKWGAYKRHKRATAVARRKAEREEAAKQRAEERAADLARRSAERAAAAGQRAEERAAAADRRRRECQDAAEARRQRAIELAAAKSAKKTKRVCEAEKPAPRQAAEIAPSREPAVHAVPQPRAQPIVVRQTPGAPRYVNYAERMNASVAYLRQRGFVVQRHSRDEIIARWRVSGWTGLFSNEQLVHLAEHHGLELRA